jgi:predicted enzyme related to lactoylglutathione lyase
MDLNSILIGTEDAQRLTDYYRKLFGEPSWSEGGYTGWLLGSGSFTVAFHDQVHGRSPQPGRVIWNIESRDVRADFDRLVARGAIVVQEPYGFDGTDGLVATLADPDDNYFQLMSPMPAPDPDSEVDALA